MISSPPTVQEFFKSPWNEGAYTIKSTYVAVLYEARAATGRHIRSGRKLNKHHGSWLGALGYLVIVDLLANVVKNPLTPKKGECTAQFVTFLRQYQGLSYDDACTIYALRCSLAHNFGLNNIALAKRDELRKRFTVVQGTNALIRHDIQRKAYVVDLEKFGDLMEDFHRKVRMGDLKLEITLTTDNFLIYRSSKQSKNASFRRVA